MIDDIELNAVVEPDNPGNLRLDDSSTPTLINITWDKPEGISSAIITYQLSYSLTRLNGTSDRNELLVSSVYCFMCSRDGSRAVLKQIFGYLLGCDSIRISQ